MDETFYTRGNGYVKNSWSFPRQPGFPWRISGSHRVPISSVIAPPRPHCGTSPSKARSGTLVAVHRSSGSPLEGPHHRAKNPWNSGSKIIQLDPQFLFLDPRFFGITKQCTEYWIHPCHIAIYYNILKLMLYQKSLTQMYPKCTPVTGQPSGETVLVATDEGPKPITAASAWRGNGRGESAWRRREKRRPTGHRDGRIGVSAYLVQSCITSNRIWMDLVICCDSIFILLDFRWIWLFCGP